MEDNGAKDVLEIRKNDPTFPPHLDFDFLRRETLAQLGKFSGKVWTDHNVHDPGITIMEVLIYALLDLGYRVQLPIEDLLALQNRIGGEDDNFFTPNQILANNPTTILDYRKMLLDIDGVRNAWLEPAKSLEEGEGQELYLECTEEKEGPAGRLNCQLRGRKVELNGLYRVSLQLDRPEPFCLSESPEEIEARKAAIKEEARRKMCQYRNLGEDFVSIRTLCEEEIGVSIELEMDETAGPDELYIEVLLALEAFFSPRLQYYTLPEMLKKGKPIEEIFEGRPFTEESYGFIDVEELEKIEFRRAIYLSDIYRILLDLEGIASATNLRLYSFVDGEKKEMIKADDPEDCPNLIFCLSEGCAPVFCVDRSQIVLHRRNASFRMNNSRARILLRERLGGRKKVWYKDRKYLDLEVPKGKYRPELGTYYSIQNDFPRVYQIGERQMPEDRPLLRKAQALQLKGYLLFFDQLLANYLKQLGHLRGLFSMKPDSLRPEESRHTYFAQTLEVVPAYEKLLRFYGGHVGGEGLFEGDPLAIPVSLATFNEEILPLINQEPKEAVDPEHLQFDAIFKRRAAAEKFRREFFQNDYQIEVFEEKCGFFFILKTAYNDVILISKRRYTSKEQAELEADSVAFFGTLPDCYREINHFVGDPNASGTDAQDNGHSETYFSFEIIYHTIDYLKLLQQLVEKEEHYYQRRNAFLEHLLSRFAVSFTDYSLMMFRGQGQNGQVNGALIESKGQLLYRIDDLSRNRGRAFNYCEPSWNTKNVSGLEQRAAALAGIPDYKREHLCNFEVVGTDEFSINIRDYRGNLLFKSQAPFPSSSAAKSKATSLLEGLKEAGNYRMGVTNDRRYGFFVEHQGVVYTHPQTFRSPEERDKKLNAVLSLFCDKPFNGNVFDSERAYHLSLQSTSQAGAYRKGKQEFKTAEQALNSKDDFVRNINNPRFVRNGSPDQLAELQLARSPVSPEEFIDFRGIQAFFRLSSPSFKWEMQDSRGNSVLRSVDTYSQPQAAAGAFVEALGKKPGQYRLEINESEGGFLLSLKNKKGKRLGSRLFGAEAECEEAKAWIKEYLEHESQETGWLLPVEKAYHWQVRDEQGRVLLESKLLFRQKRQAMKAWRELQELGADEGNYEVSTTDSGAKVVELIDKDGRVVASSPELPEAPAGWIQHLRPLWPEKSHIHCPQVNEAFGFQAAGPAFGKKPALASYPLFKSRTEALLALHDLAQEAVNRGAYFLTGDDANLNFSFSVRSRQGAFIAAHPETYEAAEERDEALQRVIEYFEQLRLPMRVADVFRYQLIGQNRGVLLESVDEFMDEEQAKAAFMNMLHLAAHPAHCSFSSWDKGKKHGLSVKDGKQQLAHTPWGLPGREAAQSVLQRVREIRQANIYRLGVDTRPLRWKYAFWWENSARRPEPLLESLISYDSKADASQAYQTLVKHLPNVLIEDVENEEAGEFTFQFRYAGWNEPMAIHTVTYSDPEEREQAKAEAARLFQFVSTVQSGPVRAPEDVARMVERNSGDDPQKCIYRVLKKDAPLAFHPCNCFNAGQVDAIKAEIEGLYNGVSGLEYFEICLGGDIVCKIEEQYHYLIRGKADGKVYFISYQGYGTKEEAIQAFEEEYLLVVHLASRPDNYCNPDAEGSGGCVNKISIVEKYAIEAGDCKKDDVPLVVIPAPPSDSEEEEGSDPGGGQAPPSGEQPPPDVDEDALAETFCKFPIRIVEVESEVNGKPEVVYKYYFRLLGAQGCPAEDADCAEDWRSTGYYDTPKEAWRDFRLFLQLLQDRGNYRPFLDVDGKLCCWKKGEIPTEEHLAGGCCSGNNNGNCCFYITLVQVLAKSVREYDSVDEAWGRHPLNVYAFKAQEGQDGGVEVNLFTSLQEACAEVERLNEALYDKLVSGDFSLSVEPVEIENEDEIEKKCKVVVKFADDAGELMELFYGLLPKEGCADKEAIIRSLLESGYPFKVIRDRECYFMVAIAQSKKWDKLPAPDGSGLAYLDIPLNDCSHFGSCTEAFFQKTGLEEFLSVGHDIRYYVPTQWMAPDDSGQDKLHLSFNVVNDDYWVARHPYFYSTSEERGQVKGYLANCAYPNVTEIEISIREENALYHYIIQQAGGDELWKSYKGYNSQDKARQAAEKEVFEIMLLGREKRYYISSGGIYLCRKGHYPPDVVSEADKKAYCEASGSLLAVHTGSLEINNLRNRANYYPFVRRDDGYGFQLYCPDFTPQVSNDLEPCVNCPPPNEDGTAPESPTTMPPGGILLESIKTYASLEEAGCHFENFLKLIRYGQTCVPDGEEGCGAHSFMIVNPNAVIATHPQWYSLKVELGEAIQRTIACANKEGLHLVEHILLRPRSHEDCSPPPEDPKNPKEEQIECLLPVGPKWDCCLVLGDEGEAALEVECLPAGEADQPAPESGCEAPVLPMEPVIEENESLCLDCKCGAAKLTLKAKIQGEGTVIPAIYTVDYLLTRGKQKIIKEISKTSEFTVDGDDYYRIHSLVYEVGGPNVSELIELGRTRLSELAAQLIQGGGGICAGLDEAGAQFRVRPCRDYYIPFSDPYSFWATVVLPGWTERFREPNFRDAFQHLLRREAPAHLGLRILWLGPKQFCQFESLYESWLRYLSGEPDCDDVGLPCSFVDLMGNLEYCPLPGEVDAAKPDWGPKPKSLGNIGEAAMASLFNHSYNDQAFVDNVLSQFDAGSNLGAAFKQMAGPVQTAPAPPTTAPAAKPGDEVDTGPPQAPPAATTEPAAKARPPAGTQPPAQEPPVHDIPPADTGPVGKGLEDTGPIDTGPAEKEAPRSKAITGDEPTTPPIAKEEPLSRKEIRRRMRKRVDRYATVVKAKADVNMRKSKMFEQALGFLSSDGSVKAFKELADYVIQYGLKRKGAEVERYRTLLENALWFCLDSQVMANPEKVQDKATLQDALSTMQEQEIGLKQIAENWNGPELQSWMDAPVVDDYLKLMRFAK